MPITLSLNATTETSATFKLDGLAADGNVEIQLSSNERFEFCVCPIYTIARATPATMSSLNQRASMFARARSRRADGTTEDWSNVVAFRTLDGIARTTAPAAVMIEPAMIVMPQRGISFWGKSTVAGFPASNMGIDAPTAWRSTDSGADFRYFYCLLSGEPWDTLALLNTNLPEGTQVRLGYYTSEADLMADGPSYTPFFVGALRATPNLPGRPGYHGLVRLPGLVTYRFVAVSILGPVTGGLTHIEHAIFGHNRMTKNHALEKTEAPAPLTTIERKRSGFPDRVRGLPMRKVDFELQMLTEAQYETIYGDLWRREGEAALVIPNSKSGGFLHDRMLFGDLSAGRTVNPSSPRYNRQVTVNSII